MVGKHIKIKVKLNYKANREICWRENLYVIKVVIYLKIKEENISIIKTQVVLVSGLIWGTRIDKAIAIGDLVKVVYIIKDGKRNRVNALILFYFKVCDLGLGVKQVN